MKSIRPSVLSRLYIVDNHNIVKCFRIDAHTHSSIVFNEPVFFYFFYRYQTHTCLAKFIVYPSQINDERRRRRSKRNRSIFGQYKVVISFRSLLCRCNRMYVEHRKREREKENRVNFVCHRCDV